MKRNPVQLLENARWHLSQADSYPGVRDDLARGLMLWLANNVAGIRQADEKHPLMSGQPRRARAILPPLLPRRPKVRRPKVRSER